jgi:ribosome-associated protein
VSSRLPPFLEITPRVRIPGSELHLAYSASGGPGGQHVNKVASKALLRWNLVTSSALVGADRDLVLSRLASRLSTDGDVVLASDRHRDQPRNAEDVIERLRLLVRAALHRDPPRRKTRATRASRERRLAGKKRRSDVKRGRRAGGE